MMHALAGICACIMLWVPVAASAAAGLLTIDVRDVDINDVIEMLAAQSSTNIVTDGSVKPERVTVHLHDVTFEEALRVITSAHSLTVRSENGIFIVGQAEAMNRRGGGIVLTLRHAQADDIAKDLADALSPGTIVTADKRTSTVMVVGDDGTMLRARRLVAALDMPSATNPAQQTGTSSYPLRFLRADDVVAKVKATIADGAFLADEEHNAILATGDERVQQTTRNFLASVDRPSAQVMFEVKVADVTPINDASNFGLEFGGLDLQGQPIPGAVTYNFVSGTIPVNVTLNAMVSKGRASILATPKLVTINNKEADLTIGETYPIVYSTSVFGGQNVQYVDIGVHLRLTPTIGADGSVTADLHPEYSELVGFTPTGYPIVANRKIDSTLRVKAVREVNVPHRRLDG